MYDDRDKSLLLTDAFEVHFLEMPKFERMEKDLNNSLHRWLMYLDEKLPDALLKELMKMDPQIKKTEDLLLKLSSDEETYRLYEAREHSLLERNSLIADSEARGIEKGIELGIEKGEKRAMVRTIKMMLEKKMDISFIAEFYGRSVEEIEKLME
ncbi:Rpn family recombination-promoting nuclease/putative transposase [Paenibacillus cremeus]|uniref:Rpn family recombination-promoting nuclease/putative transposase n=1 Tax=Paenibacillus cremeus TaxID=2163881 RepID=A0A559K8Z8_9BACL|nr:Rpn family recombination-promoting nuclease/putative transposase [Paenibacillus cremeus]